MTRPTNPTAPTTETETPASINTISEHSKLTTTVFNPNPFATSSPRFNNEIERDSAIAPSKAHPIQGDMTLICAQLDEATLPAVQNIKSRATSKYKAIP